MSGGLFALLDDIAVIAKAAAASIDDIGVAATRASTKAIGVVIDDTAVTPRYVTGFSPERELPIIKRIAIGSLKNKLLYILPAALLLSQIAPWSMTPLLMLGGAYLCFEGAEKVWEWLVPHGHAGDENPSPPSTPDPSQQPAQAVAAIGSAEHEEKMVSGAIRTDFILSAEIMAIALQDVSEQPLLSRGLILVVVALIITALVYGLVALIVKMDDIGLRLAQSSNAASQSIGRALVQGMPKVLSALSVVGTLAMLWVGGHIILVGLDELGWHAPYKLLHDLTHAVTHALHSLPTWLVGAAGWLTDTLLSAVVGLVLGAVIVAILHILPHKKHAH